MVWTLERESEVGMGGNYACNEVYDKTFIISYHPSPLSTHFISFVNASHFLLVIISFVSGVHWGGVYVVHVIYGLLCLEMLRFSFSFLFMCICFLRRGVPRLSKFFFF